MLFTELNADVLLHIYGCLDPIDSINLAETCTRLRDVAQLHYKRFKIFNLERFNEKKRRNADRHNRIDATTVLKHIGPFIHVFEADLDVNEIGSDVGASIREHCVNVKTLHIYPKYTSQPEDHLLYIKYSDWLRKLKLTKISLTMRELLSIDLSETTTLEELHIHYCTYFQSFSVDYGPVDDIFERNVNITCLRIPLIRDFKYEIFEKLKCLKRLVLDIDYDESRGQLEKVSANLKMTALEKVELKFGGLTGVDGFNEFLGKLSENALHLKHLSIGDYYGLLDQYPLSSLHLLNLTSLRWMDKHPHLYKEIPKMQPNLTHLELRIHDGSDVGETLPKPMEQIVFLIKNLEKLELLHIQFLYEPNISSTLEDFLQESVLCGIFDCHAINRPTVTLRLLVACMSTSTYHRFPQVELDLGARKWIWTIMQESNLKDFVEHRSPLPFCDLDVEEIDELLAVERFSGSATDLNAVKDEAIEWI